MVAVLVLPPLLAVWSPLLPPVALEVPPVPPESVGETVMVGVTVGAKALLGAKFGLKVGVKALALVGVKFWSPFEAVVLPTVPPSAEAVPVELLSMVGVKL